MYRMGQHNGWTYIGMPTVVCDAQSKLRMRTSMGEVVRIASKVSFWKLFNSYIYDLFNSYIYDLFNSYIYDH
jgi:hypothetical protein